MNFTEAQLQTLRTWLDANADGLDDEAAASALNATASPDYWVWRNDVPAGEIFDLITWANYTPADAPDSTATWTNRSLACQGKQFNLQTMLIGSNGSLDCGKPGIRAGLNDATTALPSGAGGQSRSGGWANIVAAIRTKATVAEKLFGAVATGTGNNGANPRGDTTNPDNYGTGAGGAILRGLVTSGNVSEARNL